ncbi:FkbM family methyltransferase [Oxalobacteraceae bacterium A2-2]
MNPATPADLAAWDAFAQLCAQVSGSALPRLDPQRPVWIFGAGGFGRALGAVLREQGFQLAGFVETSPSRDNVDGVPLRSWQQLSAQDREAQLALGIFNRGMPYDGLVALARGAGFAEVLMPWHSYAQFEQQLGWRYWLSNPHAIAAALPQIEATWRSLADSASRQCLLDLLSFRLGHRLAYGGFRHDDLQYYNDITLPGLRGRPVSYIDGGAYNGDTFIEAAAHLELGQAWLFEPDADNYRTMVDKVRASGKEAICLPCALSDQYGILSFEPGGEAATIVEGGSQRIVTLALDQLLPSQRIDFLKLDVEGAEAAALRGARQLIERSRPVLAMSLYHLPRDPWELPAQLREMCPGYRYYLRQHYYNSFDSVLYAIPDAR